MEALEILKLKLLNKPFTIIVTDNKTRLNYEYTFSFDEYHIKSIYYDIIREHMHRYPFGNCINIMKDMSKYIDHTLFFLEIKDIVIRTTISDLQDYPMFMSGHTRLSREFRGRNTIIIPNYQENILSYYSKLKHLQK